MLRTSNSLATAQAIVNLLIGGDNTAYLKKSWWIEAYQNGREQGFIITDISKVAYYICEGRGSDTITIYKGSYAMQSIADDAYSHIHSFKRDFDKAVDWLRGELLSYEEKN